ncbi:MAG TPA: hypothetical protein VEA80_07745 [Vitreimonas sp.]|uniref:hypothetical protein n=1 Tax=Vitreimonas sp. TaxID=3069702 RepID=UPI002D2EB909|nr:hypothetical protein [Vitreimonas sp.]HYD87351.1 hypothetical protein [Vitreimonas sp.]
MEEKRGLLDAIGSLLAKVVGGGFLLLLVGLVRNADDVGRGLVRASGHAIPVEQSARAGGDEGWRIVSTEAPHELSPSGDELAIRVVRESVEQSDAIASMEQRSAQEESIAEDLSEGVADLAKDIAQEGVEEGLSNLLDPTEDDRAPYVERETLSP